MITTQGFSICNGYILHQKYIMAGKALHLKGKEPQAVVPSPRYKGFLCRLAKYPNHQSRRQRMYF